MDSIAPQTVRYVLAECPQSSTTIKSGYIPSQSYSS